MLRLVVIAALGLACSNRKDERAGDEVDFAVPVAAPGEGTKPSSAPTGARVAGARVAPRTMRAKTVEIGFSVLLPQGGDVVRAARQAVDEARKAGVAIAESVSSTVEFACAARSTFHPFQRSNLGSMAFRSTVFPSIAMTNSSFPSRASGRERIPRADSNWGCGPSFIFFQTRD